MVVMMIFCLHILNPSKRIVNFAIILTIFLFVGCTDQQATDNSSLIHRIDKIPVHEILAEIELDSLGQYGDTLQIVKTKKWARGKVAYEVRENRRKGLVFLSKSYFSEISGDKFYAEVNAPAISTRNIFEANRNTRGQIESAKQIFIEDSGSPDTVHIKYDYYYSSNNQLQMTQVTAVDDESPIITDVYYNQDELAVRSVQYSLTDTIETKVYDYRSGPLQRLGVTDFNEMEYSEIFYNALEQVDSIKVYDIYKPSMKLLRTTMNEYDQGGGIISRTRINHKSNTMVKSLFVRLNQ